MVKPIPVVASAVNHSAKPLQLLVNPIMMVKRLAATLEAAATHAEKFLGYASFLV